MDQFDSPKFVARPVWAVAPTVQTRVRPATMIKAGYSADFVN